MSIYYSVYSYNDQVISWRMAEQVKEFSVISIIADVDDDPVFSGLVRWMSVRYQHSSIRWQSTRAGYSVKTFHVMADQSIHVDHIHTEKL